MPAGAFYRATRSHYLNHRRSGCRHLRFWASLQLRSAALSLRIPAERYGSGFRRRILYNPGASGLCTARPGALAPATEANAGAKISASRSGQARTASAGRCQDVGNFAVAENRSERAGFLWTRARLVSVRPGQLRYHSERDLRRNRFAVFLLELPRVRVLVPSTARHELNQYVCGTSGFALHGNYSPRPHLSG